MINCSNILRLLTIIEQGLVKQCGGVDKLPTRKQLAGITNYIYQRSDIAENSNITNLLRDETKTALLGFKNKMYYLPA